MGKRGPPPRPVALHRLAGTYNVTRHGPRATEPQAPGDLRDEKPPRWLSARQRAIWRDIVKRAPPVLRPIDRELLAQYVELVDRHQRAAAQQAKLDAGEGLPLLIRGAAGLLPSPYLGIMTRASLVMVRLAAEMGFTPSGRARLGQPEAPRPPADDNGAWSQLRRFPVIAGGKAARNGAAARARGR
jgi:P27 family predicted phage terminase small subunit